MRAKTASRGSADDKGQTTHQEATPLPRWIDWLVAGLIFIALFVYLWKVYQPHLLYYGFGVFGPFPLLPTDSLLPHARLSTAAGPLSLLTNWLSQWYCESWLGALIIAAVLLLLFAACRRLVLLAGADHSRDLAFVPLLLALVMVNRYDHPLQAMLAVGLAVWMAVLYLSWLADSTTVRVAIFAVLYAVCYLLAGGSALLFALIVLLVEGLVFARLLRAGLCAAVAVLITLLLARVLLGLDPRDTWLAGTPLDPSVVATLEGLSLLMMRGLYAAVPATVLWIALWTWLGPRVAAIRARRRSPAGGDKRGSHGLHWPWVWLAMRQLAVVTFFVLVLVWPSGGRKYPLATHYLARQQDWQGVLKVAAEMKAKGYGCPPACLFDVDRALAHLGRMGDELCAYSQDVKVLAFLSVQDVGRQFWFAKLVDLHFDLGDLNTAEQDAYELLEMEGPCPFILEALSRVHIAKGEYEAAATPLKVLLRCPAFRQTASRRLAMLADPSRISSDPEVVSWRKWRRNRDHEIREGYFDEAVLDLLQDHPDNRLAFEYLMGYYLLTYQRAKIIDSLGRLRDLGYKSLPRHVMEAMLIEASQTHKTIDLRGWSIDPSVRDQFERISTSLRGMRGNKQAAASLLAPQFGDTYAYYSAFNVSGAR
jgi:hypothetical protein